MKPKQQTKQQLMEQIAALQAESKADNERANAVWEERSKLRLENFDLRGRLPHWVAASFILLSFAIGLYTGHKITQRAKPEPVMYGSLKLEDIVVTNLVLQVETVMTTPRDDLVWYHTTEPAAQPKYRQIHHTKGAERLRR